MLPTHLETQSGQAFSNLLRLVLLRNLPSIIVDQLLSFVRLLVVLQSLY